MKVLLTYWDSGLDNTATDTYTVLAAVFISLIFSTLENNLKISLK